MLIVLAQAQARPERREDLAAALAQAAVTSRSEPGCLAYTFQSNVEDPNAFTSIEQWEARADLDVHLASPHVAELLGALPDLVTQAPRITAYEVSSTTSIA